jgi:hypothetical protein
LPQPDVTLAGKYNLSIRVNAQKRVSCTHRWRSYERRLLGVPTKTFVMKTVSDALIKHNTLHGIPGPAAVDVVGYNTANIRGQC